MGEAFLHGNGVGNPFNVKVIGGLVEKANPKENTVWIHTDVDITCWHFSYGEPTSPVPGMVWIKTIANATCVGQFNAIRKHNCIEVYPQAAYQYIGGAWVAKPAQIRKNGSWVDWELWVFKSGEGLNNAFSGFSGAGSGVVCGTDSIYCSEKHAGDGETEYVDLNETFDVTPYSTAHFTGVSCDFNANGNPNNSSIGFHVGDAAETIANTVTGDESTHTLVTDGSFSIDITDVVGEVKIGFWVYSSAAYSVEFKNITIKNIWFT